MTLNTALQKIAEQLYHTTQVPQVLARETGRAAFRRRMEQEQKLRTVISQACQQFADSGTLPIADAETGLFILDRFAEANRCGETMRGLAQTEGPWLKWLLIDYWNHAGVLRWYDRLNYMKTD